jgi:hypothetical protein
MSNLDWLLVFTSMTAVRGCRLVPLSLDSRLRGMTNKKTLILQKLLDIQIISVVL